MFLPGGRHLAAAWFASAAVAALCGLLAAGLFGLLAAALLAARAGLCRLAVAVAHAAGPACFLGSELVRRALLVRSLAAFAGNFTLTLWIHRSEPAVAGAAALLLVTLIVWHVNLPVGKAPRAGEGWLLSTRRH